MLLLLPIHHHRAVVERGEVFHELVLGPVEFAVDWVEQDEPFWILEGTSKANHNPGVLAVDGVYLFTRRSGPRQSVTAAKVSPHY